MVRTSRVLPGRGYPWGEGLPAAEPPPDPARARRVRELRESARGPVPPVDAEALAETLVRRARFTRELAARLVEEMRDEGAAAAG